MAHYRSLSDSISEDDDARINQLRIRHITSIQVRNLTPFPARDTLTSTLVQPVPASTHLGDDMDLLLVRKRNRRVSTNSIATIRSLRSDGGGSDDGGEASIRKKRTASSPKVTARPSTSAGPPPVSPPLLRIRPRSISRASMGSSPIRDSFYANPSGQVVQGSIQRTIEKVISSRLVETFLTLSLPPPPESSRPPTPSVSKEKQSTPTLHKRSASVAGTPSASSRRPPLPSFSSTSRSSPRAGSSSGILSSRQASSSGVKREGSASPTPRNMPPRDPRTPPSKATSSASPRTATSTTAVSTPPPSEDHRPVPFFISPFYRPSTNPLFSADPRRDFADWVDTSDSHVVVSLWGRGPWGDRATPGPKSDNGKGKGKEKVHERSLSEDNPSLATDWHILQEWSINLNDLIRLPQELASQPSLLPSNTLLVTLAPSGETFYLPPPPTTPPSPTTHISDGEVDARVRGRERKSDAASKIDVISKSLKETRMKKSAGFQDLVKLANLQTCIMDMQQSMNDIIRVTDTLLERDVVSAKRREVSEREEWVKTLREERNQVHSNSERVGSIIQAKKEELRIRREILAQAMSLHRGDLLELEEGQAELDREKKLHSELLARLSPVRTTLLLTLSDIFPIEPLEPQDLLFTILSIPLPIPVGATDPAPPLTLSSHPSVNDETIASALGYIAQLVNLVAAYLGRGLVYPVTCVGSRSLIRDPISAMMGPRMFPLYSKGVDTYRFEYAVFLLNKDIEILMSDRDLRALDMRHTLPNLKNLLLTVTSGASVDLSRSIRPMSPAASGLRSPPPSDPKPATPPPEPSTETTPTPSRMPFLSPIAGFLRSRYPSSVRAPTVKVVVEAPEAVEGSGSTSAAHASSAQDSDTTDSEDESGDDRTIGGRDREVAEGEDKPVVNGHVNGDKHEKQDELAHAPPTLQV